MVKERRCALLTLNIRHRGSVDHGQDAHGHKGPHQPRSSRRRRTERAAVSPRPDSPACAIQGRSAWLPDRGPSALGGSRTSVHDPGVMKCGGDLRLQLRRPLPRLLWSSADCAGQVFCAYEQRHVALKRCVGCPYAAEVDLSALTGGVRCQVPYARQSFRGASE